MAMAARMPMIATTIISSTSVKPPLFPRRKCRDMIMDAPYADEFTPGRIGLHPMCQRPHDRWRGRPEHPGLARAVLPATPRMESRSVPGVPGRDERGGLGGPVRGPHVINARR